LLNLVIPSSVVSIGSFAFSFCYDLKTVAFLGKKDPGVGKDNVFRSCQSLSAVCVTSDYSSDAFCGVDQLSPLSVCDVNPPTPTGRCGAGVKWSLISGNLTIEKDGDGIMTAPCDLTDEQKLSVKGIVIRDVKVADHAFDNSNHEYDSVDSLETNFRVEIGEMAFYGNAFSSIDVSARVIGRAAFSHPQHLKSLKVNSPVIGDDAFFCNCDGCNCQVPSLELHGRTFAIGKRAFSGVISQTLVLDFLCETNSIGDEAFSYNTGITEVSTPCGIPSIGKSAFAHCTNLQTVTFNWNTLHTIMENAFEGCTSLYSLELYGSVTSIRDEAFKDCSNLRYVIYRDGTNDPGAVSYDVFKGCDRLQRVCVDTDKYQSDSFCGLKNVLPLGKCVF